MCWKMSRELDVSIPQGKTHFARVHAAMDLGTTGCVTTKCRTLQLSLSFWPLWILPSFENCFVCAPRRSSATVHPPREQGRAACPLYTLLQKCAHLRTLSDLGGPVPHNVARRAQTSRSLQEQLSAP